MGIYLGIETSCDDTSIAIYEDDKRLSSKTFSQIDIHQKFGGIVPEVASRNHILKIRPLLEEALLDSNIKITDIDCIGVTSTPGLVGSLFVGVSFARGLGYALNKPVLEINHLLAHSLSAMIEHKELKPPFISLIISGGHTHAFLIKEDLSMELLSKTLDDAAGEAFDKVSKAIGGPYPGGPYIEQLSEQEVPSKQPHTDSEEKIANLKFPIAMPKSENLSFSGIKTAAINAINKNIYPDIQIAKAFQECVAQNLSYKINKLYKDNGYNYKLVVCGGVACNNYIRNIFQNQLSKDLNIDVYFPSKPLCNDNGDMVAFTAYYTSKIQKLKSS